MNIFYTLYPQFVRRHFPQVRRRLTGQSVFVTIFKASARALSPRSTSSALKTVEIAKPAVTRRPLKQLAAWALNLVIGIAILVGALIFAPQIYYALTPSDTQPVATLQANQPATLAVASPSATPRPLPPQDQNLPQGDWLIIPKIGIRTQLQATENPDDALNKGVWMVPEYGRPGDTDKPVILAAHRFGWKWWWKDDYWKYNSFYLLPDTQPGDIIETIHDQRKYYYQIYAGEEGEEITDYSADMILYTCKFLNSPIRHFRYAKLLQTDASGNLPATQVGNQNSQPAPATPSATPAARR